MSVNVGYDFIVFPTSQCKVSGAGVVIGIFSWEDLLRTLTYNFIYKVSKLKFFSLDRKLYSYSEYKIINRIYIY
jgi:hypothetical protein